MAMSRQHAQGGYQPAKAPLGLLPNYFNQGRGTAIQKLEWQTSIASNQPDTTRNGSFRNITTSIDVTLN